MVLCQGRGLESSSPNLRSSCGVMLSKIEVLGLLLLISIRERAGSPMLPCAAECSHLPSLLHRLSGFQGGLVLAYSLLYIQIQQSGSVGNEL